jgi:hypothetical protein
VMVAHRKLMIAKLKHGRCGASSERGRKLLDQKELQRTAFLGRAENWERLLGDRAAAGCVRHLKPAIVDFGRRLARSPISKCGQFLYGPLSQPRCIPCVCSRATLTNPFNFLRGVGVKLDQKPERYGGILRVISLYKTAGSNAPANWTEGLQGGGVGSPCSVRFALFGGPRRAVVRTRPTHLAGAN